MGGVNEAMVCQESDPVYGRWGFPLLKFKEAGKQATLDRFYTQEEGMLLPG